MTVARALNRLWTWQCRKAARAFWLGTRQVAKSQAEVLDEILSAAQDSDYGRQFAFRRIDNPRAFQQRVPIVDYEDLQPWIERAAEGRRRVLTAEPIRLFQPTSGSSGGEKLTPYTPLLQRQFQRAIQAWIYDLYRQAPAVQRGRAYWSITPGAHEKRSTSGGIAIGFDDDVEYLNPLMRLLVSRQLAVPSAVAKLRDPASFRYATLCHLLASEDLSLISVWSPTFLTSLLSRCEDALESICHDLHRGRLSLSALEHSAGLRLRPNPPRARRLREIFRACSDSAARLRAAWPQLAVISCWTDAAAALYVPELATLFPDVPIQPKGLIATEGVVSIPLVGRRGAAAAIHSHFFEFLPCDDSGRVTDQEPRLTHQLERQARYQVLLTTGGGLYRYRLGDVVEVVDNVFECPLLRFVGRTSAISDLVGEKLAESHVRKVLDGLFGELKLAPRFAMLAPDRAVDPGYRLFLECDRVDAALRRQVASLVEQGLRQNPHYRYAVAIQQLRPVEVTQLEGPPGVGWRTFQFQLEKRGQRVGDIKPLALDGTCDWVRLFAAENRREAKELSLP